MCKQAFSESSLDVQMHTIMELFFPQKIAVKVGGGRPIPYKLTGSKLHSIFKVLNFLTYCTAGIKLILMCLSKVVLQP